MPIPSTNQSRFLGQTQIAVSPIGLGGNKFTGDKGIFRFYGPKLSQEGVNNIVKAALDGGINWFDTAELYGFGQSEKSLAAGLRAAGRADGDVVIATKWTPFFRTAGNLQRSIGARQRFLANYTIDLYMVHFPYSFSSIEREMAVMAELVKEGKIRAIGVSNFHEEQMRRAHAALEKLGLPLAVNQVQYSLLHRKIESNGVLAAAKELGVAIVAWGPLGSGLLSGKYHDDPQRLDQLPVARRLMLRRQMKASQPLVAALNKIGAKYNTCPAQVAVNWLIHCQGETVLAIPGASKPHHAAQSAAAMRFKLDEEDMAELDELSAPFR